MPVPPATATLDTSCGRRRNSDVFRLKHGETTQTLRNQKAPPPETQEVQGKAWQPQGEGVVVTISSELSRRAGFHGKPDLLVVANDFFHPVGHRVQHLLPRLRRGFEVTVVSLAPPLARDKPGAVAWWWRAAAGDVNLLQLGTEALGLSRLPLPGVAGPLGNYSLLQWLLRTKQGRRFDLCLASGPVPGS